MSPATETQHVLTGLEPVVSSWCVAGFSGGHISLNNSARSLQPCGLWYNPDERLAQRGGDGHKKKGGKRERERESWIGPLVTCGACRAVFSGGDRGGLGCVSHIWNSSCTERESRGAQEEEEVEEEVFSQLFQQHSLHTDSSSSPLFTSCVFLFSVSWTERVGASWTLD